MPPPTTAGPDLAWIAVCDTYPTQSGRRIHVTMTGSDGLLPSMQNHSECASHVATGAAMGGLDHPTAAPTVPVADRVAPPSRLASIAMPLAAAAVLLAACSTPPTSTPTPNADAPDSSAAAVEPKTPDNAPTAEPSPPAEDELAATWEAFHAAWTDQASVDDPDPAAFQEVAVDPDRAVEMLAAQRGGSRLVTAETELWPRFDITSEQASITDCAIVAQHPEGQPDSVATVTTGWEATAVATNDGWRIDTAQQRDLFCIAEELNEQLRAAYATWLKSHADWYQPPDPDHPLLAETMADPGLSDMRSLLAAERDAGISMRFPHVSQAVVTEVGFGTARVTDCYQAPEGYGAFDTESGERREDVVPAPEPDQLNRTVADLERVDGRWKVVGWRWEEQSSCSPGETRYAVS